MNNSKLTQAQSIEILAVDLMGWVQDQATSKGEMGWYDLGNGPTTETPCVCFVEEWNPYEDWNHFRLLEERIMEDGKSKLCKDYLKYFDGKAHLLSSDLEERLNALIPLLTP